MVCDLDGVVYRHHEGIPGAGEALEILSAAGYRLLFVTNSSTTTPTDVARRIEERVGFRAEAPQVVTSAMAAVGLLDSDEGPVLVVGGEGIRQALGDREIALSEDWREVGAVVVGLDFDLTYGRLKDATLAIRRGAAFLATNEDPTFPTHEGEWPGAGAIVTALRAASGRKPVVAGKPHEPMRRLVRERLGPGPTWVVGDRRSTDLAMAASEGWRGVLVETGVTDDEGGPEPDLLIASLADLPDRLSR